MPPLPKYALAGWPGDIVPLEEAASAVLSNPVGEVIKAGLIDRYGLADAVIERNEDMRGKMIVCVRQAETFLIRPYGLTGDEKAEPYVAANSVDLGTTIDLIKDLLRHADGGVTSGCRI